jgi:regulator of protease activity HflC (stomatin/prohibitin superfamily)
MTSVKELFDYLFNFVKIWVIVQPWETGLLVRRGKHVKKLSKGLYFKIPYFDSVYIQEARLRVVPLSMQTLTTKDGKTVTLNGAVGYSIQSIEQLYNTLYHPELTIQNIIMGEIAKAVYGKAVLDLTPEYIQDQVMSRIKATEYGITFQYFKITNFAVVRTYRLIQDQTWVDEGIKLNEKK